MKYMYVSKMSNTRYPIKSPGGRWYIFEVNYTGISTWDWDFILTIISKTQCRIRMFRIICGSTSLKLNTTLGFLWNNVNLILLFIKSYTLQSKNYKILISTSTATSRASSSTIISRRSSSRIWTSSKIISRTWIVVITGVYVSWVSRAWRCYF